MSDNQKNWDNYWQGRTAVQAGSALVGVENNLEIQAFWNARFESLSNNINVLDLACGAGTVAGILTGLTFNNVSGVDISDAAISVLKSQLPAVKGYVAPSESLPFDAGQFDLIVSQFGFEYGDYKRVIPEIVRTLKPSGEFLALAHKSEGVIHTEVLTKFNQMEKLKNSGLADITRELFKASFSNQGPEEIRQLAIRFRSKRIEAEGLADDPNGFARYFLNGIQDLFQRKAVLGLDEMLSWLSGMEKEMDRFIGRMDSMDKAAINDSRLSQIENEFIALGAEPKSRNVLRDSQNNELGWIISVQCK